MKSADVLSGLLQDARKQQVEIVQDKVVSVARADGRFVLTTHSGTVWHALSVVVASGSRPLANELAHLRAGVYVTYKGFSFLKGIVAQAVRYAKEAPVLVVTNCRLAGYAKLVEQIGEQAVYLVPPGDGDSLSHLAGATVECTGWRIVEKTEAGFLVSLEGETAPREITVGSIFLDYVAFQQKPLLPALPDGWSGSKTNVPQLSSFLQSPVPGLFFAGDVTCRYASVATALADGVVAGFGAYRHAYGLHFGHEPPLFAYRAGDDPARFLDGEWPNGMPPDS